MTREIKNGVQSHPSLTGRSPLTLDAALQNPLISVSAHRSDAHDLQANRLEDSIHFAYFSRNNDAKERTQRRGDRGARLPTQSIRD